MLSLESSLFYIFLVGIQVVPIFQLRITYKLGGPKSSAGVVVFFSLVRSIIIYQKTNSKKPGTKTQDI